MNKYLIIISFFNADKEEFEIEAESNHKAVITLIESQRFGDKNIETIRVNRLT